MFRKHYKVFVNQIDKTQKIIKFRNRLVLFIIYTKPRIIMRDVFNLDLWTEKANFYIRKKKTLKHQITFSSSGDTTEIFLEQPS